MLWLLYLKSRTDFIKEKTKTFWRFAYLKYWTVAIIKLIFKYFKIFDRFFFLPLLVSNIWRNKLSEDLLFFLVSVAHTYHMFKARKHTYSQTICAHTQTHKYKPYHQEKSSFQKFFGIWSFFKDRHISFKFWFFLKIGIVFLEAIVVVLVKLTLYYEMNFLKYFFIFDVLWARKHSQIFPKKLADAFVIK